MKIKFKVLATAAALALVSSMASAAINTSTNPDLLFVAYDSLGETYTRDLGSLSQLSSSTTFSAPTGSIFASQFANTANSLAGIQWNVFAVDTTGNQIYLTGDATVQNPGPGDAKFQAGVLTNSLGGLTQLDALYAKANGEYTGSTTQSDQTNGITLANNFSFGNAVSGQGVGASQNLLLVKNDASITQLYLNSSLAAFDNNSAGGYFTLTDAQGDLSWTNGAVAAVPLPAAVLLFAPALLAMFGLGRRRQNNVA